MEFQVLGPLRAIDSDGTEVRLASAEQRRLLSQFIIQAGSVLGAELLADRLGLSHGALRTSVSRLRRVVGSELLVTAPPGYQFRSRDVDSRTFEELLAKARSLDDVAAKRSVLERALGLWRGDAYAEFVHERWALVESRRLEELRAGALEDLVETMLGQEQWSEAIARLEPLIAVHPFRDRPRALLMQALAQSGRRVDALRAFQSYRTLLVDEVGTEPSSIIVALDREIARDAEHEVVSLDSTVSFLLTDLDDGIVPSGQRATTSLEAILRYYEVLDQVIVEAGGVRPVEQGEGEKAIGVFARPEDAVWAAVEAQRRLTREMPALGVAMAVYTCAAQSRGQHHFVGGMIPRGERLRACGHGGQILVSDTTAALAQGALRDGVGLVELGTVSFHYLGRRERVWQAVHSDLANVFPPLRTSDGRALVSVGVGRRDAPQRPSNGARVAGRPSRRGW
jgi:DNA-binding SARP family transcriptional activator